MSITLTELRDPIAAATYFRNHDLEIHVATPTYVRHKEGETTIIAYEFELADGAGTVGYVHWCANATRADEIYAKARSLRPRQALFGPGLVRVDEQTVLYGAPNDARLRRMRWYTDPRKLKRSMPAIIGEPISARGSTSTVLRYKPERRMVCRVDIGRRASGEVTPALLRYTTKAHAQRLHATAQMLGKHGVCVPTPLGMTEGGRVSVDAFMPGDLLHNAIVCGSVSPARFAEELLTFHGVARSYGHGGLVERKVGDELLRCQDSLANIASLRPALASATTAVRQPLTRVEPDQIDEATVLLHGDLHSKNVLVADGGVTFIDLERVTLGSPAVDLGFLYAHALALPIRRPGASTVNQQFVAQVIEDYRRTRSVSDRGLGVQTAIGLIDQALLVIRHLEPLAESVANELLDLAHSYLEPARSSAKPRNTPEPNFPEPATRPSAPRYSSALAPRRN